MLPNPRLLSLPVIKLEVTIDNWPIHVPRLSGHVIRGIWGDLIRHSWLAEDQFIFQNVFKTENPGEELTGTTSEDLAHPFVLETDEFLPLNHSNSFRFSFLFLSHQIISNLYIPLIKTLFQLALELWKQKGNHQSLNKINPNIAIKRLYPDGRKELILSSTSEQSLNSAIMETDLPKWIPDNAPKRVLVHFKSPYHFKKGRDKLHEKDQIASILIELINRIIILHRFYGANQVEFSEPKPDFNDFQVKMLRVDSMKIQGKSRNEIEFTYFGKYLLFELDGNLDLIYPWLYLGKWLQTGPKTSMGWGKYDLLISGDIS